MLGFQCSSHLFCLVQNPGEPGLQHLLGCGKQQTAEPGSKSRTLRHGRQHWTPFLLPYHLRTFWQPNGEAAEAQQLPGLHHQRVRLQLRAGLLLVQREAAPAGPILRGLQCFDFSVISGSVVTLPHIPLQDSPWFHHRCHGPLETDGIHVQTVPEELLLMWSRFHGLFLVLPRFSPVAAFTRSPMFSGGTWVLEASQNPARRSSPAAASNQTHQSSSQMEPDWCVRPSPKPSIDADRFWSGL